MVKVFLLTTEVFQNKKTENNQIEFFSSLANAFFPRRIPNNYPLNFGVTEKANVSATLH